MAKKRKNSGQQRAINAADKRKIIELLREYGTRADAARLVGASYSSLRREWLRDPKFEREMVAAELYAKSLSLRRIQRAGDEDWRADSWMLERKYGREYGRKNPDAIPISKVAQILSRLAEKISAAAPVESHAAIRAVIQFEIEGLMIAKGS